MTVERPRIEPGLLAELLAAAPSRVRRKLDAAPRAAEGWTWTARDDGWAVAAGGETVRLGAPEITDAAQVGCTCLLSPRCLHLLSVAGLLAHTGEEGGSGTGEGPSTSPDPGPESDDPLTAAVELDDEIRAAARFAWTAGAHTLAAGVRAAGAVQRVELLRAAAMARAARLPRLAAACTTVSGGLRDHATPAFTLTEHAAALTRLLDVSWRLGGGPDGPRPAATLADVGIGRRAYTEVGSLRLYGLGSESVVTGSGYAGVVTHAVSFADGAPRMWRVGDVAPGGAERAAAVYGGSVNFGGLALSHRDLTRSGLVAQRVSASADGRLSGGAATTAAAATGCAWTDEPLAALWARPFDAQVDAALAALAAPAHRTGADLVFAELVVAGPAGGDDVAVVEAGTGRALVLSPGGAQDRLRARNLARLAAVPGLALRAVARPVPNRPGVLVPVAVAVGEGLALPEAWRGRVNLSLDTVAGPAAASVPAEPASPLGDADPGLAAMGRVLARLSEAGREAAPSRSPLNARLREHHLPTAAALLTTVTAAARERVRTPTGESVVPPPDRFAAAWLAATTYLSAAESHLHAQTWAGGKAAAALG
ncbi:hypothetical protein [Actinorugispora endophytica]|uniref:SWIM-type domain-containing protein n=1 Tax=Actinorugispora endophytica TaxID=1605990 RepID=A0A4R6UAE4_9ACTN|nr:hypothetical protein [Actinorugispora endophytica]TDQ43588.1 hypothetical protein EV190_1412 [Actinorugispora endophytica]